MCDLQCQPTVQDITHWSQDCQAEANAEGIDVYTVYYGSNTGQQFLEDNIIAGDGEAHIALSRPDIAEKFVDVCTSYVAGNAGLLF